MKRLLLVLGVFGMVLALSCSIFDWHNDIEYPVFIGMSGEKPGNPITLNLQIWFDDQTPDTSGVEFNWSRQGDTLRFMLEGTDGDIDHKGPYFEIVNADVGVLDKGVYTLIFEGEGGMVDTLSLTVEDSLYHLVGDSSKVIKHIDQTLRRIFKDMLFVYLAGLPGVDDPRPYLDSITVALATIGAEVAHVANGTYSIGPWNWYDAVVNGWIGEADGRYYTFNGDTVQLDSVYKVYIKKGWLGALGVEMGNGFYRLYEPWNE